MCCLSQARGQLEATLHDHKRVITELLQRPSAETILLQRPSTEAGLLQRPIREPVLIQQPSSETTQMQRPSCDTSVPHILLNLKSENC